MLRVREDSLLFKFLILFRLFIVGMAGFGLYLQLFPNFWFRLTYYTLISNFMVAGFYLFVIFKMVKSPVESMEDESLIRMKAGVTVAILLTFLVYMILLAPIAKPEEFYHWKNYTLHYIVPISTTVDWLLFDRKGCYKRIDPVLWTVVPIFYAIFSLVKGGIFRVPIPMQEHSPYPYFFLNIDKYGWGGFFKYFIGILACYMVIGYLMFLVKKNFKKNKTCQD